MREKGENGPVGVIGELEATGTGRDEVGAGVWDQTIIIHHIKCWAKKTKLKSNKIHPNSVSTFHFT